MSARPAAALWMIVAFVAGCSPAPTPDPAQAIHIQNNSDRAVIVSTGGIAGLSAGNETAVRPCGSELTLQIRASDYEPDGRLLMGLAFDDSGELDRQLRQWEGDPASMPGSFKVSILWSDGTLAGHLPLYVTIHPDLTVDKGSQFLNDELPSCLPAF